MGRLGDLHVRCWNAEAVKKVSLSVIVLAFAASSVTLWLLESPFKAYALLL